MTEHISKNIRLLYNIIAVLIIAFAVCIVFRGFFSGEIIAHSDGGNNDLTYFNIPTMYHYAEALKQGTILQWNPYIYGGFPIFAEGQGSFLYPVNVLIHSIFDFLTALNLFFILHSVIMGAGVYFFTKKLTGSGWASLAAGIAAALCGSMIIGHNRHLNIYAASSMLPWLLLTAEIFIQNRRIYSSLFFGSLMGILLLIGHPQYAFICAFTAVLYFFLRLVFPKTPLAEKKVRPNRKQVLLFIIISIAAAAIIGIAQAGATFEIYSFTERSKDLGEDFTSMGSLPFEGIFTFIYPYWAGNIGNNTFTLEKPYYFWEFFHYSGVSILLLAIYGSIWGWKKSGAVKSLVIIAVVSYLLALGGNFFLIKIFSILPVVSSFRFPARWLLGTEIALTALSGYGLLALGSIILNLNKEKRKKAGFLFSPPLSVNMRLLISLAAALIVFLDIYLTVGKKVTTADSDIFLAKPGSADAIKRDSTFGRFAHYMDTEYHATIFQQYNGWEHDNKVYKEVTTLLPLNLASIWNIPVINGYMGLVPDYIYEIWGNPNNPGIFRMTYDRTSSDIQLSDKTHHLLKLWGVKYASSPMFLDPPYYMIWDSAYAKVFKIDDVFPRAWTADRVHTYPEADAADFARLLFNPEIDYTRSVTASEKITLPAGASPGRVKVLEEDYHYIKLKAETAGLAVLSDTWFPRWKAYVNGKKAKVYKVNGMMRGVISPAPGSVIEMKYSSGGLPFFMAAAYLVMAGSVVFFFWERKKKETFFDKEAMLTTKSTKKVNASSKNKSKKANRKKIKK